MINQRIVWIYMALVVAIATLFPGSASAVCEQGLKPTGDCLLVNTGANLMRQQDTRIHNGHISVSPSVDDIFGFGDIFGPPNIFRGFKMQFLLDGKHVAPSAMYWTVNDFDRDFSGDGYVVRTSLTLAEDAQVFMLMAYIGNQGEEPRKFVLSVSAEGSYGAARMDDWATPGGPPALPVAVSYYQEEKIFAATNSMGGMYCYVDMEAARPNGNNLEFEITVEPDKYQKFRMTCSIGDEAQADHLLKTHTGPITLVTLARRDIDTDLSELFDRLPHLVTNDYRVRMLYDRSVYSLLASRWEGVVSFNASPYYYTGGMDPSHISLSLADYFPAGRFMTLTKPEISKNIIRKYLAMRLDRRDAFGPVSVSQAPGGLENYYRITRLIYDYIAITGDVKFLKENVGGIVVLDHLEKFAEQGLKTLEMPELKYYEESELRGGPSGYAGYSPLLNAQRVWIYRAAADLYDTLGKRKSYAIVMRKKANYLEKLINEKLWNERAGWYYTPGRDGVNRTFMISQIFGMIETGVPGPERAAKMAEKLNRNEFLSDFGFLPVSRVEPYFKEESYNSPSELPRLIESLYGAGLLNKANESLIKILWWGDRLPYIPPAVRSDAPGYDPEKGTTSLAGLSLSEAMIFGYFGIRAGLDGEISVAPSFPRFARMTEMREMNIRGHKISIIIGDANSEAVVDGKTIKIPNNERTTLVPGQKFVDDDPVPITHCPTEGAGWK